MSEKEDAREDSETLSVSQNLSSQCPPPLDQTAHPGGFSAAFRRRFQKITPTAPGNSPEGNYAELLADDDSPYPEVRASVPNTDNRLLVHNTLRMWTIGLLMTTIGSALNVLFSLHGPIFQITTYVVGITAWPLGRLWDRVVPNKTVLGIPLNPGPFNIKEHALIIIMANVAFGQGAAYMTDVVLSMKNFYHIDFGWGFGLVSILASQAIGYSMAGMVRRVLVFPASMIWPSNLVATTFLTNIHLNVNHIVNGWRISRLKFFLFALFGSFVWSWIPGFLAPFLSYFSFNVWLAPQNVVTGQMFGSMSGLGLIPITFDWNQVTSCLGSPLVPPFFAIGNILASIVVVFWIITPIIHFSNVWFGRYVPMSSSSAVDRYQNDYNVTRILSKFNMFDIQKYQEYSPLFLPTTFAMSYAMSFAAITATIMHTILFYGKDIMYYWKHSQNDPDDVHMRLMKRYKEVPTYWFGVTFLVFFGLAIISVRCWETELPVWALVVALVIAFTLLIPVGMIFALTNIGVGLNVLTEFIIGYMVPGRPIAMMLFKTFGYITNVQAVTFLQDMKLGHYLKIAPRTLFMAQLIATIWGSVCQISVVYWAQGSITRLCELDQQAHFNCPAARVFFNASVIWGVIGPQRQFSSGQLYHHTLWFFIVGALLPLITYIVLRFYPKAPLRNIHWPVFFNGVGYIPPATVYTYGTYCIVGYIFGYLVKRRYFSWWAKYNYSLSAGLDLGLALGSLLIFLILLSPSVKIPNWWGSQVIYNNTDANMTPMIVVADGGSFGPDTW